MSGLWVGGVHGAIRGRMARRGVDEDGRRV